MRQPSPPHPALAATHEAMLHLFGEAAVYFGSNRIVGQLYAALLLSHEPLCLDDLARLVDRSKASICNYIQVMEHLGIVRRVYRSKADLKSRCKYYEAKADVQVVAADLLRQKSGELDRIQAIIGDNLAQLQRAGETGALPPGPLAVQVMRLNHLYAFMTALNGLITTSLPETPSK